MNFSPADAPSPADSPRGSTLTIRALTVAYGPQPVIKALDLSVATGETLVILGESGCGKTSLLKAIAGTVPPAAGAIELDGVEVTSVPAARRGIVDLDQEPLLFEHLTVAENLAFALRLRRVARATREAEVHMMLDALDLNPHRDKHEWQLSGGQKQRVAFGRAVLAQPRLLLLDEPFGSLDGKTRHQMQNLFAQIVQQRSLTSLFVTHDVKESLIVGNAFARMAGGSLYRYQHRQAFMLDPATGIPAEMRFWSKQQRREES